MVGFSFAAFASTYFIGDTNSDGERLDVYSRLKFTLLFVFPCFIWLVSAPIFSAVEKHISLMLLSKVATFIFLSVEKDVGHRLIIPPQKSASFHSPCKILQAGSSLPSVTAHRTIFPLAEPCTPKAICLHEL